MTATLEPISYPVIGILTADSIALRLGTGYWRFSAECGIDGLAKVTGNRLDILAVVTKTPGKGQFREFIRLCKLEFNTIAIWGVWNPMLNGVLLRYGFNGTWTEDPGGDILTGWLWQKPQLDAPNH